MKLVLSRGLRVRLIVYPAIGLILVIAARHQGNRLFYWPNNVTYSDPVSRHVPVEDVWFAASDGTRLHGWFIPASSPASGTVLYYHGNARNLTDHYEYVSWLPKAGYNLFLFDYRGFGQSAGHPDREGLALDSIAALRYIQTRPDVDKKSLVVLGQSLGGACALAALGETDPRQVRAVAVESTFYSYREVAREHLKAHWTTRLFSWPLATWGVTDEHSPSLTLDRIAPTPLLVIHGDADPLVPFSQGQRLYDQAGQPKTFIRIPGGRHCGALMGYLHGYTYRKILLDFFAQSIAAPPVSADSVIPTR
jgi:hypothetical protein